MSEVDRLRKWQTALTKIADELRAVGIDRSAAKIEAVAYEISLYKHNLIDDENHTSAVAISDEQIAMWNAMTDDEKVAYTGRVLGRSPV